MIGSSMKTPKNLIKLILCTSIITTASVGQAQLFSSPTGHFDTGLFTNSTLGAVFTVGSQPIQVTALGVYDSLQDGLFENHDVGIWGSSGLITSTTIPSGTGATLIGTYRYLSVPSVTLAANTTYTIGAFFDINTAFWDHHGANGTSAVDPAISSAIPAFYSGNNNPIFTQPTFGYAAGPLWAANMTFQVVPEPGTFTLAAVGLGLLLFRRRK